MKGPLPFFLLILGLVVIGLGMMQDHRLETDLAPAADTGVPQEVAFIHYYVIGAVIALAGIVGLVLKGRN